MKFGLIINNAGTIQYFIETWTMKIGDSFCNGDAMLVLDTSPTGGEY